jgi:hypothetical protein
VKFVCSWTLDLIRWHKCLR